MPLTKDEYRKIAKAFLYMNSTNLAGVGFMVQKSAVYEILNDYSPDLFVSYKEETDGKQQIKWIVREEASG